jgi:cell division transport system ATP-binding protein
MAVLERINAGGTTVLMATHEAGIVDQMQRRVIELASGEIVRDERQGGYKTTAIPIQQTASGQHAGSHQPTDAPREQVQIAAFATGSPANASAEATLAAMPSPAEPVPAEPVSAQQVRAEPVPAQQVPVQAARPAREQPPAVAARFAPPAQLAQPAARAPEPTAPTAEPVPTTAADSGMPIAAVEPTEPAPAAPVPAMARPVVPAAQHDVTEQLTLAEKLGLRAPGERPDQTGEQNVGPTR